MFKKKALAASAPAAGVIQSPPVSATQLVYQGIARGLERGSFVPGQRLVEGDLADFFEVGRNSVREALQRLAADGIVDLNRNRGASIRSLSLQETHDVLEVAELLTGLLARVAARNARLSPNAMQLENVLEELDAFMPSSDPEAFGRLRRRFYRTLLELAENSELNRMFPAVQLHIVHAQFRPLNLTALRIADYAKIGQAVLAGNSKEAERAGVQHVRHVRELIDELAAQPQD
ncbi:GntR family transcriptional regulator [Caballeronia hypogeia]|uniref:GntR family transcriptional regulator n=1 Tax=Caballeronia hypogeia TaxID=1777140 RepID=A0A158D563_9BURK|nr:GntR family transcriptional regulator [Caballeronia hypogeia]SAK88947.1 GntR family transcriptional regulator [Caballeronia hypogeia]